MTDRRGGGQGQVRIIGGQWRSRRLSFSPAPGLRPTTDRVRETLFNWLAPALPGARCVDLFAGSGALGLEALSRGAAFCHFVDSSPLAIREISKHLLTLEASKYGNCVQGEAENFLSGTHESFDIAFLDPPFGSGLSADACTLLRERQLLSPGALVYLEADLKEPAPAVPTQWTLYREKKAGGVAYRLFEAGPFVATD